MTRFFIPVLFTCFFANSLFGEAIYSKTLEAREMPIGHYLEWQTVTEVDVTTFVVEKSTDGRLYFELGSVAGSGYSMVDKNYHFMDVGATDKKNFYRLKEVTEDGTISYTLPILVEKKMVNDVNVVAMTSVDVANTFKLTADVMRDCELSCSLKNFSGKEVESFKFQAVNGLNDIQINLENHPAGTYKFVVQLGSETETITLRRVADERATRPQVATTKKLSNGGRQ